MVNGMLMEIEDDTRSNPIAAIIIFWSGFASKIIFLKEDALAGTFVLESLSERILESKDDLGGVGVGETVPGDCWRALRTEKNLA